MLLIDCTDCFTRVEFSQNTISTEFDELERVLTESKDRIKLFQVEDYMFEFVEYVKETSDDVSVGATHQVIGKYIAPIPHLTYMAEEEIWFKVTERYVSKFTFFFDDELVISMHGMLFFDGEFKENLIHRFNISEIRNLTDDLCAYVLKNYHDDKKPINIWNSFKCIGIYAEKTIKNDYNPS